MLDLRSASFILLVLGAALTGCSKQQAEPAAPPEPTDAPAEPAAEAPPAAAERPQLTADECSAQGGTVVGDIGDGAIHRPDYKCPSGAAPSGSIRNSGDGPVPIEGSVCCPG